MAVPNDIATLANQYCERVCPAERTQLVFVESAPDITDYTVTPLDYLGCWPVAGVFLLAACALAAMIGATKR